MAQSRRLRASRWLAVAAWIVTATGCATDPAPRPPQVTAPSPKPAPGSCGTLSIAYDPANGYEASAFIIGRLASSELDCEVNYVKTTSRRAWRLVAEGEADVYLDAYGDTAATRALTVEGGPVTVLGPNGVPGGVDLLAPFFLQDGGVQTAGDLDQLPRRYYAGATPSISTVPPLLPLAEAFVESQRLDFNVRDFSVTHPGSGMADLLQAPKLYDASLTPGFFLVEGPRAFLGSGPGRYSIEIPDTPAGQCLPKAPATVCTFEDFDYMKIVSTRFARSNSPAYNLVYNYRLPAPQVSTILDLVELSGFQVGEADVVSWINTHPKVWKRWLN